MPVKVKEDKVVAGDVKAHSVDVTEMTNIHQNAEIVPQVPVEHLQKLFGTRIKIRGKWEGEPIDGKILRFGFCAELTLSESGVIEESDDNLIRWEQANNEIPEAKRSRGTEWVSGKIQGDTFVLAGYKIKESRKGFLAASNHTLKIDSSLLVSGGSKNPNSGKNQCKTGNCTGKLMLLD